MAESDHSSDSSSREMTEESNDKTSSELKCILADTAISSLPLTENTDLITKTLRTEEESISSRSLDILNDTHCSKESYDHGHISSRSGTSKETGLSRNTSNTQTMYSDELNSYRVDSQLALLEKVDFASKIHPEPTDISKNHEKATNICVSESLRTKALASRAYEKPDGEGSNSVHTAPGPKDYNDFIDNDPQVKHGARSCLTEMKASSPEQIKSLHSTHGDSQHRDTFMPNKEALDLYQETDEEEAYQESKQNMTTKDINTHRENINVVDAPLVPNRNVSPDKHSKIYKETESGFRTDYVRDLQKSTALMRAIYSRPKPPFWKRSTDESSLQKAETPTCINEADNQSFPNASSDPTAWVHPDFKARVDKKTTSLADQYYSVLPDMSQVTNVDTDGPQVAFEMQSIIQGLKSLSSVDASSTDCEENMSDPMLVSNDTIQDRLNKTEIRKSQSDNVEVTVSLPTEESFLPNSSEAYCDEPIRSNLDTLKVMPVLCAQKATFVGDIDSGTQNTHDIQANTPEPLHRFPLNKGEIVTNQDSTFRDDNQRSLKRNEIIDYGDMSDDLETIMPSKHTPSVLIKQSSRGSNQTDFIYDGQSETKSIPLSSENQLNDMDLNRSPHSNNSGPKKKEESLIRNVGFKWPVHKIAFTASSGTGSASAYKSDDNKNKNDQKINITQLKESLSPSQRRKMLFLLGAQEEVQEEEPYSSPAARHEDTIVQKTLNDAPRRNLIRDSKRPLSLAEPSSEVHQPFEPLVTSLHQDSSSAFTDTSHCRSLSGGVVFKDPFDITLPAKADEKEANVDTYDQPARNANNEYFPKVQGMGHGYYDKERKPYMSRETTFVDIHETNTDGLHEERLYRMSVANPSASEDTHVYQSTETTTDVDDTPRFSNRCNTHLEQGFKEPNVAMGRNDILFAAKDDECHNLTAKDFDSETLDQGTANAAFVESPSSSSIKTKSSGASASFDKDFDGDVQKPKSQVLRKVKANCESDSQKLCPLASLDLGLDGLDLQIDNNSASAVDTERYRVRRQQDKRERQNIMKNWMSSDDASSETSKLTQNLSREENKKRRLYSETELDFRTSELSLSKIEEEDYSSGSESGEYQSDESKEENDKLCFEVFIPIKNKHIRLQKQRFIEFTLKYSIFLSTFLFWVASLSGIAFSGWMLSQSSVIIDDFTDVLLDPYVLLCVVAAIIFLVSFFGSIGALRENVWLLRLFHITLTVVIVFETLLIILVFLFYTMPEFRRAVKIGPEELLKIAVKQYFDDDGMKNWIDLIQREFQCCGVSMSDAGYLDWQDNPYFSCAPENLSSYRCSVPVSCCIFEPGEYVNLFCGRQIIGKTLSHITYMINTKGCMKSFGEWLGKNDALIGYVAIGVLITQVFGVFAARFLIKNLNKRLGKKAKKDKDQTSLSFSIQQQQQQQKQLQRQQQQQQLQKDQENQIGSTEAKLGQQRLSRGLSTEVTNESIV